MWKGNATSSNIPTNVDTTISNRSINVNVFVTCNRVPIHVIDQIDETQYDNGDFLFAGNRYATATGSDSIVVHEVLLRVVGRWNRRRFRIHYLLGALDAYIVTECLCRHHNNTPTVTQRLNGLMIIFDKTSKHSVLTTQS